MKLTTLTEKFDELSIEKDSKLDINQITDVRSLVDNGILFVKDRKNAKKLFEQLATKEQVDKLAPTFIVSKKYLEGFLEELPQNVSALKEYNLVSTENFDLSLCALSKEFFVIEKAQWNDEIDGRKQGTVDIHPSSVISPNSFLGKDVVIGENCVIHDGVRILSKTTIGDNTEIFPNVVIYQKTNIGKNVRIHANTTVGSDGYGYNFINGVHEKIYHMGGVEIGDNVEIGSGSTIDMGTFSPTVIGSGTKLDNLVQIAHNVQLGNGVIICSQSGVAGSTTIGDFTVIGGATAVTDHIEVGKGCQIGGKSGVTGNLEDGAIVSGYPARPVKEWLRGVAYLRKASQKK
jgi:UDP-3-O-[3-hydroxymyristoyl] glucosamine N-acyltransferase